MKADTKSVLLAFICLFSFTNAALCEESASWVSAPQAPASPASNSVPPQIQMDAFAQRTNHDAQIIQDYSAAIRSDPRMFVAYETRGRAYADLGDLKKAIADFSECIRVNPQYVGGFSGRAQVLYAIKDYNGAISDYSSALYLDHANASLFRNRALAYTYSSNFDAALGDITECMKLDGNNPRNIVMRGIIYQHKGDFTNAIADFTLSLKQNPNDIKVYGNRGFAFLKTQQYEDAISDFTMYLSAYPASPETLVNRASAFQSQGEWGKAVGDLTEALRYDSNNPALYDLLASNERQNGDIDGATRDLKHWLQLKPGDPMALRNLQALSDASQRLKNQLEIENLAILNDPSNGVALGSRGNLFAEQGEFEKATNDFYRAVELEPKNALMLNNFAWVLATALDARIRNGKLAVELASKACALTDWKNYGYIDTLAAAYAEAGDFENAIKYSRMALVAVWSPPAKRPISVSHLDLYVRHLAYHAAIYPVLFPSGH